MKRIPKTSFLVQVLLAVCFPMLLSLGAQSQNTFLYTNDNVAANTVTAFSVAANGTLSEIRAFSTGGAGNNCGLYVSNRVAVSNARNLLFASNSVSNDVSVFSINSNNGSLTFVGRFPTGGLAGICSNNDISGISLTVTPDDRFLMAGNAGSNDVTVFSVAGDGSLTPISGSPFSAGGTPDGMKISANGAFLGIGLTQPVGVLSIAQSGTVTPAPGSPFQGSGADSGVDIKCSGNQLFAGNATSGTTIIDVFDFPANGSLSPIAGSPFQPGVGVNSNGVLLSPHGQFLFVSNQGTGTGDDTITVFRVAANGSLTLVPGSPFAVGSNGATPTLMATNQAGTFLFVANTPFNGGGRHFVGARDATTPGSPPASIGVFSVAADGSLTEVGTPTTVPGSSLEAIAVYPTTTCTTPAPLISQPLVPDSAIPGGPAFTLTVNGTGFVSGSVVNWNGGALPTTVVSDNQVTATVPAANIASAGTASVTVTNPTGSTSNAAFFTATTPTDSVVFSVSSVAVGMDPQSATVADFNRDGIQDIAVVNYCGNDPSCQSPGTVSILLGNGDGTFSIKSTITVGILPVSAAVGDFNGDGIPDLVVINSDVSGGGTFSILLGNGNGTFSAAAPVPVGLAPSSVVVADFNGDGNLDFVVTDSGSNTIAVCLGNGDGTFPPCSGVVVGNGPYSVATGDFNNDGIPDLAVTNVTDADVTILLGNGDGTFNVAGTSLVGSFPLSIVTADLNRDGKLDLAVSNHSDNTISVLLGNGDGTFQNQVTYSTGSGPFTLVAGDLNGDGILDLAVSDNLDLSVSVLLGNGDGTFQTAQNLAPGSADGGVALGDFNGDGRLDLAAAFGTQNTLSILLQSPVALVNPHSLDFGNQTVNTTSSTMTVQLSNTGTANLNISGISISGANGSDFAQTNDCPASLPFTSPGNTCTIQVTFTPSATGIRAASLTISDNAAGSPQTVSLTGIGVQSGVELSPATLPFGNQTLNITSSPQIATLQNTGTATLVINNIQISGTNSSDFAETNNCGSQLGVGGSCQINVTFTPSALGARSATLSVTDDAPGSPQTVSLTGTGTPIQSPPTCAPQVQSTSNSLSISVTANCSSTGTIVSTTINWGDGTSFPGPVGSHTYSVAGPYTVTVTAIDNLQQIGTASQLVVLTTPPPPVFAGQQTSVNFVSLPVVAPYHCTSAIGPQGQFIADLSTVGISCTFSGQDQNGQVTLTINTTGTGMARLERSRDMFPGSFAFWLPFPAIVLLGSGVARGRAKGNTLRRFVTLGLALILLLMSSSCGGGFTPPPQPSPPPGQPMTDAGIYHLTAVGTVQDASGFVQTSLIVPLNVASN